MARRSVGPPFGGISSAALTLVQGNVVVKQGLVIVEHEHDPVFPESGVKRRTSALAGRAQLEAVRSTETGQLSSAPVREQTVSGSKLYNPASSGTAVLMRVRGNQGRNGKAEQAAVEA